jgi:predicted DNA-binding protein with PD1-like motif
MFKKIPIDSQVEVVSMIGDIALYQGKPVVHTHMVVATSDETAHGGHVLAAYVSPTLEVVVTVEWSRSIRSPCRSDLIRTTV